MISPLARFTPHTPLKFEGPKEDRNRDWGESTARSTDAATLAEAHARDASVLENRVKQRSIQIGQLTEQTGAAVNEQPNVTVFTDL